MFIQHLPEAIPIDQCAELLEYARQQAFDAAPVNFYGELQRRESVRNNDRLEWSNPELATRLEAHLFKAMGNGFPHLLDGMRYAATGSHFRFYRYREGQYFKPHRDGSQEDGQNESLVTALFYLNDADGGETVLMPYGPREQWAYRPISPRAGDALLFEHRVWHEGRSVNSGEKYVLRTDLFYAKRIDSIGN
ncbi:prolyl hydroxylase family protein [Burkholderia stagnalis]